MEELLFGAGLLFALFYIGLILIYLVGVWNLYKKAGQPGWACIIPIYNVWILLKIVGKSGWWLLLFFIPGVNAVFSIWTNNLLAKSFGKDLAYTLGLIFLPMIFYPILGLGSATYQGPAGK